MNSGNLGFGALVSRKRVIRVWRGLMEAMISDLAEGKMGDGVVIQRCLGILAPKPSRINFVLMLIHILGFG